VLSNDTDKIYRLGVRRKLRTRTYLNTETDAKSGQIGRMPRAETRSAAHADTYLDTLIAFIETIVAMPTLASERREFGPPVRLHPTAEHVIIYLVDGNIVVVIRVLGGRQNWRAMLDLVDA
jgi:toxin ParE1/3/4